LKYLVTGVAGFVGSTMADRLLKDGHEVIGYDNFSTGLEKFVAGALPSPAFRLVRGDLLDAALLTKSVHGADAVFHFAANADVRFGTDHPRRDFEQNTLGTLNVLEAMRVNEVRRIMFSSTGSIYGESPIIPTPEDAPIPVQTSLYGASKIAAEGFIEAYCEGFGFQGFIYRFVSLLGARYTHGHVVDFFNQLREHPDQLRVLGNGKQRKSYLSVDDCVDAILLSMERCTDKVNVFNLGTDEYCAVDDSIGWISEILDVQPKLVYSGGERGWIGDNPFILLDCARIRALGWKPRLSIRDGIEQTVRYLQAQDSALRR
jgi:UDP-glucose 4-epimerase